MRKNDFRIGEEFYCGGRLWRCTDIGTRVIIAICLNDQDQTWLNGPPYAIEELVFSEYDMPGCFKEPHVESSLR